MRLSDSVTRLRASTTTDAYNNAVRDWSTTTSATYPAEVQPVSSTEDVTDQERSTTRWKLYLPPTADLVATDRIVWDGDTFEVDGDVERWKRRGTLHHLKAILIKVTQR